MPRLLIPVFCPPHAALRLRYLLLRHAVAARDACQRYDVIVCYALIRCCLFHMLFLRCRLATPPLERHAVEMAALVLYHAAACLMSASATTLIQGAR